MRGLSRVFWWVPLTAVIVALVLVIAYCITVSTPQPAESAVRLAETLSSDECVSCHDMEEAVSSWERGSHASVPCLACHTSIAPENYVEAKLSYAGMRLGQGHDTMFASDERCLSCHAEQMPWVMEDMVPPPLADDGSLVMDGYTPEPLPVKAGHDLHLRGDNPLQCVSCHSVDGHQEPAEVAALAVTKADSRSNAFHTVCTSCHTAKSVETSTNTGVVCDTCHYDAGSIEPDTHQVDWVSGHGEAARTGAGACTQCHVSQSFGSGVQTLFWSNVASDTDFCADCHGVEMPHPEGWLQDHPAEYQADPESCVYCHGTNPDEFGGEPLVEASELPEYGMCAGCHQVELPHPDDWLTSHGEVAMASESSCDTCHSSNNPVEPNAEYASDTFCIDCHGVEMPHPDNFGTRHESLAKSEPATCAQCHSSGTIKAKTLQKLLTEPFCVNCHKKTYEHPELWVLTHGSQVKENGSESCETCHTSDSFCATCHKGEEWHPEGWTISHRWAIRNGETDVESCLVCHPTKDPCMKCHDDEPADFWKND